MTHVVKIDILTGHKEKVIYILFWRLFFIAYLSENYAFSQNVFNFFWKYSILLNEILLKYLFLKLWINKGDHL